MAQNPIFLQVWKQVSQLIDDKIARRLLQLGIVGNTVSGASVTGQLSSLATVPRVGPAAITANVNLSAGDLVNLFNSGGTVNARKADASLGLPAHGFVIAAVSSGSSANVYQTGINNQVTGRAPGAIQFLGNAGAMTETPPTTAGYVSQQVGTAISATSVTFSPGTPIIL